MMFTTWSKSGASRSFLSMCGIRWKLCSRGQFRLRTRIFRFFWWTATRWNPASGTFLTEQNPRFSADVEAALAAKGLDREATIVTLCRSGSSRGEPSAQFLRDEGFPNALFVINGFEGDRLKSGDLAGRRLENGWRNEGLPWSPKMDGGKIYRPEPAQGHAWRVILSSGDAATQAMALILSKMERVQGTPVRILLCGDAGLLAVQGSEYGSAKIQPLNRRPGI